MKRRLKEQMIQCLKVLLCLSLFTACQSKVVKQEKAALLKVQNPQDASPEVLELILKAKEEGRKEIRFEKGTYHFYPDKALEKFCFMSNHDDLRVKTAFPLINFDGFKIDGNGSTFIFHGVMIPFLIEESKNISLENITIDWAMPFHSEALVIANNVKEHSFDLKISEEYPYVIQNDQLVFVKEYYEHNLGEAILYDPLRTAVSYNTEAYTPLFTGKQIEKSFQTENVKYKYEMDNHDPQLLDVRFENRLSVKEIASGHVRIFGHEKRLPEVGKILVAKGEHGKNRIAPAVRLLDTEGFTAKNVTIHHAGGMGFIAQNCADLSLQKVVITPSNGRMVSTTADATHFVGCRGKVELLNCTFQNQLDDATNVHGTYQKVVDVLDEHRLGVRMGHFQQLGFDLAKSGDQIGLVDLTKSFNEYEKLTFVSALKVNERYQILTFKEKLPANVKAGDLLENLTAYPTLTVKDCNISRNRARGLLISTPKEVLIENNFFHTEMSAILVPVESSHWYESGRAQNLTIKNNIFQDCSFSGYDQAVISFVTDDKNQNIAFENVLMSGNTFNLFDHAAISASNIDQFRLENNRFQVSHTFPALYPKNPVIRIESAKNVLLEGNTFEGFGENIYQIDEFTKKASPALKLP